SPYFRQSPKPLGDVVLLEMVVIQEEFELGGIKMRQKRFNEISAGVCPEIRRQDPEPQGAVQRGIDYSVQGHFGRKTPSVVEMFREELFRRVLVTALQCVQPVAARIEMIWFPCKKCVVLANRLFRAVELL